MGVDVDAGRRVGMLGELGFDLRPDHRMFLVEETQERVGSQANVLGWFDADALRAVSAWARPHT